MAVLNARSLLSPGMGKFIKVRPACVSSATTENLADFLSVQTLPPPAEEPMTEPHYGLASPAEVATLSGKALLQAVIDGRLPQAPISQTMGFWLVGVGDGTAVMEGEPGPHLLNPLGTVHGGWALTLIDSVTACAGHSLLPAGSGYTTIETKGNFARAITKDTGRVRAEGRVVSQGRQIISCEAKITSADGRVLAHGSSTLMVMSMQR